MKIIYSLHCKVSSKANQKIQDQDYSFSSSFPIFLLHQHQDLTILLCQSLLLFLHIPENSAVFSCISICTCISVTVNLKFCSLLCLSFVSFVWFLLTYTLVIFPQMNLNVNFIMVIYFQHVACYILYVFSPGFHPIQLSFFSVPSSLVTSFFCLPQPLLGDSFFWLHSTIKSQFQ